MRQRRGILANVLAAPICVLLVAGCSKAQVSNAEPAPVMTEAKPSAPKLPESPAGAGVAPQAPTVVADAERSLGGDRDVKGCIGSAGYTWSHLLGKCIRIFEAGVRLEPRAKSLDKTLAAFAIFAPGDDSRAELFLPSRAPVILARDGDKQAWRDGAYVLTRVKRTHTLSDVGGAKLYEGTAK